MTLAANVIVDKLGRIKNAWDTGHPDYAFKYYLYNHVGEDRANMYQKPPADDLAEWEKAWVERPNKGCVLFSIPIIYALRNSLTPIPVDLFLSLPKVSRILTIVSSLKSNKLTSSDIASMRFRTN